MEIKFVYGKIDVQELENVDAVICPTDTVLSGSGGLDRVIHQAAGPGLAAALQGKRLSEGEVLITKGFDLPTKYIVHAAVPKADRSDSSVAALSNCYMKVLRAIDNGVLIHNGDTYTVEPCSTAAITLLGTGSAGWSYNQSMKALWDAILQYHCEKIGENSKEGALKTLYLFYPPDAHFVVYDYRNRTSQIFFDAPCSWGGRGERYLWNALMYYFDDPRFNRIKPSDLIVEVQRFFHKKAGTWLAGDTNLFVKEYSYGGMGSGKISSFMAEIGIPLLCSNLSKQNLYDPADWIPGFLIPVTMPMRNVFNGEHYQLLLPYELLPELVALRRKTSEMTERKRTPLVVGQPYYLTMYHYNKVPNLVDCFSLDVEKAQDSHYRFSEEAAAAICKHLGYMPNAIGAALGSYLKEKGGLALEMLVKKYAAQEQHFD